MQLANLNPLTLPSLPLENRRNLPNCSAIYFAIYENGKILYIGRANNLRNRWRGHHRYSELEEIKNVRLAWVECPLRHLVAAEHLLTKVHSPLLDHKSPLYRVFIAHLSKDGFRTTLEPVSYWKFICLGGTP